MKRLGIAVLAIVSFFVARELANAYSQIGWEVIFIIMPLALFVVVYVYLRRRYKTKDRI